MIGTRKALPLNTVVRITKGRWNGKKGTVRAIYSTGISDRFDYDVYIKSDGRAGIITRRLGSELEALGGVVKKPLEDIVQKAAKTEEDLRRELEREIRSEMTAQVTRRIRSDVEYQFNKELEKRRLEEEKEAKEGALQKRVAARKNRTRPRKIVMREDGV